ncbi:hypothetical protein RJT34_07153 [Clitoria ternatea]|uniref:Uncharacterized protein n=1 Tax=Clitoria ternatea TaxID=43366 RepID=A0AAN9PTE0_CLITE
MCTVGRGCGRDARLLFSLSDLFSQAFVSACPLLTHLLKTLQLLKGLSLVESLRLGFWFCDWVLGLGVDIKWVEFHVWNFTLLLFSLFWNSTLMMVIGFAHGVDHLVIPTRDYLFAPSFVDINRLSGNGG